MRWLLAFFCILAAMPVRAEQVNVAAASDLNFAIKEIIQQFERDLKPPPFISFPTLACR